MEDSDSIGFLQLFQVTYVEDPQLLVEIAHTLVHDEEQAGKRRTQKEKHSDILNAVCRVLEVRLGDCGDDQ
jgi:hypothetical protein